MNINLGSGHWKFEGWVNVDLDRESTPDVLADLGKPLPFRDGCADYMHTEDFLDQLELDQARAFLLECHRILKAGGVLRVLVPDLEQLVTLYRESPEELLELWNRAVAVPLQLQTAAEVVNVGMRFAGHAFMYDAQSLETLCAQVGFTAKRVSYNESEHEALRGLDLRAPGEALSLYYDCYRNS